MSSEYCNGTTAVIAIIIIIYLLCHVKASHKYNEHKWLKNKTLIQI